MSDEQDPIQAQATEERRPPAWSATAHELIAILRPRLIRCDVFLESDADLEADGGATLRSAFGAALKRTACPGLGPRGACAAEPGCLYSGAFENPAVDHGPRGSNHWPHPLVIRLHAPGRYLRRGQGMRVEMVALGPARDHVDGLLEALLETSRSGLGRRRTRFIVAEAWLIEHDGSRTRAIASGEPLRLDHFDELAPLAPPPPGPPGECSVRLVTRTRLQRDHRILQAISFSDLTRALMRRFIDLCEAWGQWH